MSLSYSNHRCIGFSSSELAEGLTQIAVNDNNKKMIAKCGAIQILVRMLQTAKDNEEKLNACNAFWTLAFDEENQMEIKANEQAISELEKLLTDENIEIQRAAAGALWECNGKERYAEEKKAESWIATDNRRQARYDQLPMGYTKTRGSDQKQT